VLTTLEALRTETEIHLLDSPDGKRQAELISQVCVPVGGEAFIFYQLSLRDKDSGEARILVQELGACGLGAASYNLTAWSADSLWLYYTTQVIPDGAALVIPSTTIRVDVTSGESTPLPGSGPVSPDGAQMAWTDGRSLVLYDLRSGEMQTFPDLLPGDLPTYLVWEPESSEPESSGAEGMRLAFVQTENPSYPFGSSTVGLITLEDMSVQVLHQGDDPALIALQGFEEGGILMGDDQGRTWLLSIPEGKLTQR
jgi:hypothetical protein